MHEIEDLDDGSGYNNTNLIGHIYAHMVEAQKHIWGCIAYLDSIDGMRGIIFQSVCFFSHWAIFQCNDKVA